MKKIIIIFLSLCFLAVNSFATVNYGFKGQVTGIMFCGDKLCYTITPTVATDGIKKFYVNVNDPNSKGNPAAFIYQAYTNGWTVFVGWEDTNPYNPGDGLCYYTVRVHTNGY